MENQRNLLPVLTVSDFLASVNQTLEYAYPCIEVEGEVEGFKVNQNKYVFFDIKDSGGSIGCFMMTWQLRTPIEDGMKVVVRATAKLTQWGKFSLTVQSVRLIGDGSLHKSYELLKAKLEKEGLFAAERKRPLPVMPQKIAVISSMQAAGYADFVKIINDRWGGSELEVAHTQVQGEAAPDQIIRAIKYFNEQADMADVLAIIRGGGSAHDLSCFSDELLVREIAASRIPTIVGVGHETDKTLADFAADYSAATPSNVAQVIVPDKREVIANIHRKIEHLTEVMWLAFDEIERDIAANLQSLIACIDEKTRLTELELDNSIGLLEAYNPMTVLSRGYAILRGREVVGENVKIITHRSEITAEVKDVRERTNQY